jgi:hypothetical protein
VFKNKKTIRFKPPPPALRILAEFTLIVESKMELVHVFAIKIMLETLIKVADLNVFSVPIVLPTSLASIVNVKIPVPVLVLQTPFVKL